MHDPNTERTAHSWRCSLLTETGPRILIRFCITFTAVALLIILAELVSHVYFHFLPQRYDYAGWMPAAARQERKNNVELPLNKRHSIGNLVIPGKIMNEYKAGKGLQLDIYPYTFAQSAGGYHSEVLNTNRQGFRTDEFESIKADPRAKVILLGGSGMWGAYASSDGTTIAGALQDLFDAGGVPLQVVSLAQPGFICFQELVVFERIGLRFNTHSVVVMNGANDVAVNLMNAGVDDPMYWRETESIFHKAVLASKSTIRGIAASMKLAAVLGPGREKSVPDGMDWRRNGRTAIFATKTKAETLEEIAAAYKTSMGSISRLATANGIRPILILQPTSMTVLPSNEKEALLHTWEGYSEVFPSIISAWQEVSEQLEATHVNGADIFNADTSGQTKIIDFCHYTDYGNRLLAEWIFQTLVKVSEEASASE